MGPADNPAAVVGPDLRVRLHRAACGRRLRHAEHHHRQHQRASIMIGEKCADLLRAAARAPARSSAGSFA